jgi:lipid II:glycine glycyltransferase (peptidoglycan interpeptide bridge formation enzyme)
LVNIQSRIWRDRRKNGAIWHNLWGISGNSC